MKLNFKVFGTGKPVIIIHGLFGMLDNWQQFAKRLSNDFKVYIIDLRNHGRSPHSELFNYDVMSEDLVEFIASNEIWKPSLVGHSMGGKLAMKFAFLHQSIIDKTIVIDIGIKRYKPRHTSILQVLNALDLEHFSNRQQIDKAVSNTIPNWNIRQFLLKNISRKGVTYQWKMNLPAITKSYSMIIDRLEMINDFNGDCLFVKGAKSDYILEEDKQDILSQIPKARFATIANSGHWVHAEQPDILLKTIRQELFF